MTRFHDPFRQRHVCHLAISLAAVGAKLRAAGGGSERASNRDLSIRAAPQHEQHHRLTHSPSPPCRRFLLDFHLSTYHSEHARRPTVSGSEGARAAWRSRPPVELRLTRLTPTATSWPKRARRKHCQHRSAPVTDVESGESSATSDNRPVSAARSSASHVLAMTRKESLLMRAPHFARSTSGQMKKTFTYAARNFSSCRACSRSLIFDSSTTVH